VLPHASADGVSEEDLLLADAPDLRRLAGSGRAAWDAGDRAAGPGPRQRARHPV